jgi:hypothetical protein
MWRIQIIYGTAAVPAADNPTAALAALQYTERMYYPDSTTTDRKSLIIQMPRVSAGQDVWCRVWCVGQNNKKLSFVYGLHEYLV